MPTIRIVTAGTLTVALAAGAVTGVLFQFAAAGGAQAQSATGKPLQLTPVAHQPAGATAPARRHHHQLAHAGSRKSAANKTHPGTAGHGGTQAQAAAAEQANFGVPASPSIWPGADTTPPIAIAAVQTAAVPLPVAAPRTVVVNGETVGIAAPDEINELDRAADMSPAGMTAVIPADSAIAPAVMVTPANAAELPAVKTDNLNREPEADHAMSGGAPAMSAATLAQSLGGVGSVSWLAQAGAALGGAIAAGAIAWLLIGGTPQRMYG
jgi:hypothetical protein